MTQTTTQNSPNSLSTSSSAFAKARENTYRTGVKSSISSLLFLLALVFVGSAVAQNYKAHTIAFYNLENLFDTENDPITFDDDRTPDGKDGWTEEIYAKKLKNMARVIKEIGSDVSKNAPVVIGVCETENYKVLQDLVAEPDLVPFDYGIVQYDSPDRRGIDVAFLYQPKHFKVESSKAYELILTRTDTGKRIYTRDQLLVTGELDGERMHFIVNHWPSRSGGEERSRSKREAAAALNKKIIDSLYRADPAAKIMTMGDLNDDPTNSSVKKVLGAKKKLEKTDKMELYNPMEKMLSRGLGTLAYRDGWNLFDQIIISEPFLHLRKKEDKPTGWQYYEAGIYNERYLSNPRGRYKGYPYRSFADGGFTNGYSDHFPVYVHVVRDVEEIKMEAEKERARNKKRMDRIDELEREALERNKKNVKTEKTVQGE